MEKFAIFYGTDGTVEDVTPEKTFSLKRMQELVGGMVEIIPLPSGRLLLGNEESRLVEEPELNESVTEIWKMEYPIEKYNINNPEDWYGPAILCSPDCLE